MELCAVRRDEHSIDGPLGAASLRVGVYRGAGPEVRGLVWVHGGGFSNGSLDSAEADVVARALALRWEATVVTVGYHTADGDHGYPSLHREVRAAWNWATSAEGLGLAPRLTLLGGASAGANLAMGSVLESRDEGEALPAGLIFVYPLVYRRASGALIPTDDAPPPVLRLTSEAVDHMYSVYRGTGPTASTPYAWADGHELTGLPPTLVVSAEYDDLRASGHRLVRELERVGVVADEYIATGVPHGHLSMPRTVPEVDRTIDRIGLFVRDVADGSQPKEQL